MSRRNLLFIVAFGAWCFGCSSTHPPGTGITSAPERRPPHTIADTFAYPIGKHQTVTQKKDGDEWFNALDFGKENHLGEDWNRNTGGNTDCGESVFAVANGTVTFSGDAGPGWGNVIIVTHKLLDGSSVQSLYGHLQQIVKSDGEVKKRALIGKVGNANERYLCHLHFEIRTPDSPMWDQAGAGYSTDRSGWVDPSDFIDSRR